jgi:hypothetical protein
MTETELKRSLIAKINQIQDPAFLKALLVITDSQTGTATKHFSWAEPSARNWLAGKSKPDAWDSFTSENFFEDMEQLLRDNNEEARR